MPPLATGRDRVIVVEEGWGWDDAVQEKKKKKNQPRKLKAGRREERTLQA